MSDETLSIADFRNLLDRHGADLDRWRDADAAVAVRRLVLASADHRRLWEEARRFDAWAAKHFSEYASASDTAVAVERVAARVAAQTAAAGAAMSSAAMSAAARSAATAQGGTRRLLVPGLAAGFVALMLLGGAFDRIVRPPAPAVEYTVRVESLVFGPSESELL